MWDRSLRKLGETLADDQRRSHWLGRVIRILKRLTLAISLCYVASLLALILIFRFVGEKNVTFAALLYLPRQGFLLPLALLMPLSLIFHRKSLAILVLAAAIFAKIGMGFVLGSKPDPLTPAGPREITVMTYNRGQNMKQSLQPFKEATVPDIIAFQEAAGRAIRYAKAEGYEDLPHTADTGEFTLLSRYPILSEERIEIMVGDNVQ
ncbi:MAG: hypothetical protein KDL87_18085, partial [Verrucomicrobiae bacterium]|nr:hypothetical protein [Verrucomicrobiae bacterium]